MVHWKILIVIAFVALVGCSEVDDVEQKKRGAGKPVSHNAIPTGAQKPEYTYSIYAQNPSSVQNSPVPNVQYQSQQLPNSFYPTQGGAQYYQPEQPSVYPQQPQLNLIPPPSQSQFVPLNFVPTPGYQSKYQLLPAKSSGNIQLAILQPPYQSQQLVPYQSLFSPHGQGSTQQYPFLNPAQGQAAPNYQLQPLGQQYVGHPSTMLLFAQPTPGSYNNYNSLLYPNSVPNLYNYYQSPQVKYLYGGGGGGGGQSVSQQPPLEYDKSPLGPPSAPKEDNEISLHSSADYLAQSESNSNYKNYVTGRSAYKN